MGTAVCILVAVHPLHDQDLRFLTRNQSHNKYFSTNVKAKSPCQNVHFKADFIGQHRSPNVDLQAD